jgi:hypothetical protein
MHRLGLPGSCFSPAGTELKPQGLDIDMANCIGAKASGDLDKMATQRLGRRAGQLPN